MDITTIALGGLAAIVGVWLWFKLGKAGSTILLLLAGLAVIGCFVFVHSFQAFSQQTQVATVHCSSLPDTFLTSIK
jgi:drug/metabolite transporter superfamily protein YnfA